MRSLLHLTQNLLEAGGHVVGLLRTSIVLLRVDKEAEEQGVHCHRVHREETGGDEVGDWKFDFEYL